jgi:hypothetical protein
MTIPKKGLILSFSSNPTKKVSSTISWQASSEWRLFVPLRSLPLFEIALVLVRLSDIASVIINANHGIV